MAPKFTLHGNVGSITSDRVRLLLADQSFTDYEFVNLDFATGEFKQPAHLERHPFGRVPTITLEDGTYIYESCSICKYLALEYGFPVIPDPKTATAVEQGLFDQAVSVEENYFCHPTFRLSGQKAMEMFGIPADEKIVEEAGSQIRSHFKIMEALLAKQGGGFMAGKEWSLVDIFYLPLAQRLINLGKGDTIFGDNEEGKGNVHVQDWWKRCLEREPVKKYLEKMVKFEDVKKQLEARKNEAATS